MALSSRFSKYSNKSYNNLSVCRVCKTLYHHMADKKVSVYRVRVCLDLSNLDKDRDVFCGGQIPEPKQARQ